MTGAALFPLRVLLQLLRVYVVYTVLAVAFSTLFFVFLALLGGGNVAVAVRVVGSLASHVSFQFACLHFLAFVSFRYHIAPRFPDVPSLITFAVAAPLGATMLAGVWLLDAFFSEAGHGSIVELPHWMAMHPRETLAGIVLSSVITLIAATFGMAMFALNRGGALNFGFARFVGGLLVGRTQYDDFARRELVRLQREYDDYVGEVRGGRR
jgi:hypothetical protein